MKVAVTDATILITGESGTGKELIARAIHSASPRTDRPFIAVNCGAIPAELLESEMFGHERGAFTGAIAQRAGMFQLAAGGTIFLDEVGEMSPVLQVKLLRVLQDREIRPVGADRAMKVDVRVVAASNKDLAQEVEHGRFREDLFYRLQVIPIVMPALRERRSDIPLLIRHFLEKHNRKRAGRPARLSEEAMVHLWEHDWPGNVRELENLLERRSYRTRRAASGAEGLRIVEQEPVDLILLDVMMPGMDGFEVCEALRALPGGRGVPVILLTARDDLDTRLEGMYQGVSEFLTKPINTHELYARVRAQLHIVDLGRQLQTVERNLRTLRTRGAPPPSRR